MDRKKKKFLWIGLGVFVVGSFLVNQNFLKNVRRFQAIQEAKAESAVLAAKIQALETQITRLEKDPTEYERLVRQSLGYLRPGEKEVRFLRETGANQ